MRLACGDGDEGPEGLGEVGQLFEEGRRVGVGFSAAGPDVRHGCGRAGGD